MGPLDQLKISKKKKIISYQKIKNSSKTYYWVLRQKKNVVEKNLRTSLYNWLFNMFLQDIAIIVK